MHNKGGVNLLVFVLVMGPLIWFSQRMHWGDTGTFVCVVAGIIIGFVILMSSKRVTRNVSRTFGNAQKNAAPDFLFAPSNPALRQQEMLQMRQQVSNRAGQWNAPSLQAAPQQSMMPHPAKRPGYEPMAPAYQPPMTRVIPVQQPSQMPGYALPAMSTRPPQQPPTPRVQPQNNGPLLELGPGAQMHLQTSLTGMLVVDAQPRRPDAPVFLEEWIRLGLGILVVDTQGQYTGYLAQMSPTFGFLAGSRAGAESLTSAQQGKYMALESTRDATHVGQNVVDEGLQVIFNFSSYRDTTDAGTYLLALLAGIERKAQEFTTKPCAILFTDARPFVPARDDDCLIANGGVAQGVYDQIMSMVEHAGGAGLKQLGICLAVPTVDGVEEDVLTTTRLWIVNCVDEGEIERICLYLDLEEDEVDRLLDGDTMLFDTYSDGAANFVRFRRAGIVLASKPARSVVERQTEKLPEEDVQGGEPGLRTEEKN
jgi:hypothetical protein